MQFFLVNNDHLSLIWFSKQISKWSFTYFIIWNRHVGCLLEILFFILLALFFLGQLNKLILNEVQWICSKQANCWYSYSTVQSDFHVYWCYLLSPPGVWKRRPQSSHWVLVSWPRFFPSCTNNTCSLSSQGRRNCLLQRLHMCCLPA